MAPVASCPRCGDPLTLGRFVRALAPFYVRCGGCRRLVPFRGRALLVIALATLCALAFLLALSLLLIDRRIGVPLSVTAIVVAAAGADLALCRVCLALCRGTSRTDSAAAR